MTTLPGLAAPPGFVLPIKLSPLLMMLGPVYAKGMGTSVVIGFHVQYHHLNRRGILHGGVAVSLADTALGYCLAELGEGIGGVLAASTVSLTVDFIVFAGESDRTGITPEGLRTDNKLALARALLHRGGRLIARASVVFAVLGGHV